MFELRDITVAPGGKPILTGVNLGLNEGSRTAVVGRSGSGKTTLLRLLCFMQRPHAGEVMFRGERPRADEITRLRRKVPLVHQEPLLWPRTVRDNLLRPFDYASAEEADAPGEDELAGLMTAVGLPAGMLEAEVVSLSGGEKQRAAIARALALRPEALLLDEPTSALDLLTAESLFDALVERYPEMTVVLVTHSPALVERCGRQVLLEDGGVRAVRDGMRADELRKFLETGE